MNQRACRFMVLAAVSAAAGVAAAQEAPNFPEPAPEHALLRRFVGEWETVNECRMAPDAEPTINRGAIVGRMLGDRWVQNDYDLSDDQTPMRGVQTIGYDPAKGMYVGTWVDTMTNHLWVYEGSYDAETRTLSLEADGPNLMGGGETVHYRDAYEFVSDDHYIARSYAQGDDGEWVLFMTGNAKRSEP